MLSNDKLLILFLSMVATLSDLDELDLDAELVKKQQEEVKQEQPTIDKEKYEHNLMKILSIQDMMRQEDGIVGLPETFYDDFEEYIKQYPGRFNRNLQYRLESFVSMRIDRIVGYALAYNSQVYEKLASSERELYLKLCGTIDDYRNKVQGKIMV